MLGQALGATGVELPKDPTTDPPWKEGTTGAAYGEGTLLTNAQRLPGSDEWRLLAGASGTFGVRMFSGQLEVSGRATGKGLLSAEPPFKLTEPNTEIAAAAELSAELRLGPRRDLLDVHATATLRGSDLSGSASLRLLGHEVLDVTGNGRVDFGTGRVRLGGEFSGPLTRGTWGYSSVEGFSASGLLLGPARLRPSDLNFGASIAQNVLQPGLGGFGLGAGAFTYSRNLSGYLGVGVGPSSYVDLYPGGVERSVLGKSGGFYVGAYLSLSALAL